MRPIIVLVIALTSGALFGCDSDEPCAVGETEGCDEGFVCEPVADGTTACAAPVTLQGIVFDALSTAPIAGARIVARDVNGSARSAVAFSDLEGRYSLPVSVIRAADGTPQSEQVTLRADADGYVTFPSAPREALPIDAASGVLSEEGGYVVADATTDVALVPLGGADGFTISGIVDHPEPGGVLVVADQGGGAVSTSITDTDGTFVLYNVPPGETLVSGYRAGVSVTPQTVTAVAAGVEDVLLTATSEGLATVSGSVNIVNAPGGLTTSVILVVDSTFDELTVRGESPAGLRAAPVSGGFMIADVPPGRYAVLAAFENDRLVRDPDEGIAGTDVVFIDVAGADVSLDTSFKVTEALAVTSPGADGLEVVTAAPTLTWAQDSSEDGYELRVYDALGDLVFEDTEVPTISGSGDISYELDGGLLEAGMIYQFRAWSWREDAAGVRSYISATEDLLGVFQFQP